MNKLIKCLAALLFFVAFTSYADNPPAKDIVPAATVMQSNVVAEPLEDIDYSYLAAPIDKEQLNQGCCKVCTVGKACGDSCISQSKTCHVGRGCACDG